MQMFPLSNLYNTLCLFQKYILAHFSDARIIVANFSHPSLLDCEILKAAASLSCSRWSLPKFRLS